MGFFLECSLPCWSVEEVLSGVPLGLMRTVLNQTSFIKCRRLRSRWVYNRSAIWEVVWNPSLGGKRRSALCFSLPQVLILFFSRWFLLVQVCTLWFEIFLQKKEKINQSTLPASLLCSWDKLHVTGVKFKAHCKGKYFHPLLTLSLTGLREATIWTAAVFQGAGGTFWFLNQSRNNSDSGRKLVKFELWLGGLSTVAATLADNQPSPGCFTVFPRCNWLVKWKELMIYEF